MRISAVSLQDILDHPGSRTIFREGMVKVSNISRDELYSIGLSEEDKVIYFNIYGTKIKA